MITRISIAVSMVLWTVAICRELISRQETGATKQNLVIWLAGFLAFIVHILAAFHEFYGWSHRMAIAETAWQTREIFGWETGLGLYVNYFFGLCLAWDLAYQASQGKRHARFTKALDGFILFMIFNGAIVFGTPFSRALGASSLLAVAISWAALSLRRQSRPS